MAASVFDTNPTLAQQLASDTLTVNQSNPSAGLSVTANTLIANKVEAETETARRLALKNQSRYLIETEQLTAPFALNLGDVITLQTPAKNGAGAIITRLDEKLLDGRCTLEFWQ